MRRKRFTYLLCWGLGICSVGVLYACFVNLTGWAIPCLFRMVTGLYCPGCGVTGMSLHLLRLEFREAFLCHPVLFVELPFLVLLLIRKAVAYVKSGNKVLLKWENVFIYLFIGLLVVYGVIRNL